MGKAKRKNSGEILIIDTPSYSNLELIKFADKLMKKSEFKKDKLIIRWGKLNEL